MRFVVGLHVAVAVCVSMTWGCTPSPDAPADGGGDGDADADADRSRDAETDSDEPRVPVDDLDDDLPDEPAEPGTVTLVAEHLALVLDRVCDLDGDGTMDNSIADLGDSAGTMTAAAMNTLLEGDVAGGWRLIYHFPWVDDVHGPTDGDAVLVGYGGFSVDGEPDNDFSGSEPFLSGYAYVDPCGEPLCAVEGATLDGGALSSSGGTIPLWIDYVNGHEAKLFGTVQPDGEGAEITACSIVLVQEAGAAAAPTSVGDLTALEMLAAGGAAYGVPLIPGISPDIDLDGDGLERLVVDDEGRLETCVDGDRTTIEGRECWSDPRMADGFSLVVVMRFVGAAHEGIVPNWERWVPGECTEPPEQRMWDAR